MPAVQKKKPVSREELTPKSLASTLLQAGVTCPEESLPGLVTYLDLLMRWNRVMNLVGARTWQEAATDLVADCLRLADFLQTLPLPEDPVSLDLGAGAGLPGIPLRLVWHRGEYHLLERRGKRALFLAQVQGTLLLPGTHVHETDVEPVLARKRADLVVSRAFLPWDKVLALVERYQPDPGHVVFMGRSIPAAEELARLAPSFCLAASVSYEGGSKSGTRTLWAAVPVARAQA